MTYNSQQVIGAYKRLPGNIQNFVMSNETTELVADAINKSGLPEDQKDRADSEILWAMFGLQTLDRAIENIAGFSNKQAGDFSELKITMEKNIFGKHNGFYGKIPVHPLETVRKESEPQELIPKTPKVPELAPENLPVATKEMGMSDASTKVKKENAPLPDYRYPEGKDPYREPLA